MVAFLRNPIVYLTTSFVLFLIGLPLISLGTTRGPRLLLWIGLLALVVAALIPPVQRLCCAPARSKAESGPEKTENNQESK